MIIKHTALAALLLQLAPAHANSPAAQEAFDSVISQNLVNVSDPPTGSGSARLTIMPGEANVQNSNFNFRTSQIENTGDKRIAAIYMDLSTAMFPDVVIDNDGTGGDDVSKALSHDWGTTETNPISIDQYQWTWQPARSSPGGFDPNAQFDPSALTDVNNLFVSELSDSGLGASGGFRGQMMIFEDFDFGETYEFSGDMDPNSIAGLNQGTAAIHAEWDVGGVSGAEISNSVVTLLFGDGTTASGTIAPDGSQAGAIAIISNDLAAAPGLNVDGFTAGTNGSINAPPSIVVSGTAGDRVRVTMMSAFDPVDNQEPLAGGLIGAEALVTARLESQYPYFPVNNARLLQHVEVEIPRSGSLDVSASFQFTDDPAVGFTAVVIDARGDPLSSAMDPIRLLYTGTGTSCPDDRKPDLSGDCVRQSCNANFICPANSVRKPNRNCYDTFGDCDCEPGFSRTRSQCVANNDDDDNNSGGGSTSCPSGRKLDGSGYCVVNSCNADIQCPRGFVRRQGRQCYDTINDCERA